MRTMKSAFEDPRAADQAVGDPHVEEHAVDVHALGEGLPFLGAAEYGFGGPRRERGHQRRAAAGIPHAPW